MSEADCSLPFTEAPPSADIADRLNTQGALVCEHNRTSCKQYCGVERFPPPKIQYVADKEEVVNGETITFWRSDVAPGGRWIVVPYAERVSWRQKVEALIAAHEAAGRRIAECAHANVATDRANMSGHTSRTCLDCGARLSK